MDITFVPEKADEQYRLLCTQLNGCLPPHLDREVFNNHDLPRIVGRMSAKAVLRFNELLPAGTEVDKLPRSIIGWSKADEWGDRSVVYRGMNYLGAASMDEFESMLNAMHGMGRPMKQLSKMLMGEYILLRSR